MGAGTFPAGVGSAGLNPVSASNPGDESGSSLRALRYDPTVRGFVTNADGSIATVHPVDQRVALALFIEKGTIPSAPNVGSRFRARLNRIDPRTAQSITEDEARNALAALLDAKDIVLLGVKGSLDSTGRAYVSVGYVNLRDPALDPRTRAALLSGQNPTNARVTTLSGSLSS